MDISQTSHYLEQKWCKPILSFYLEQNCWFLATSSLFLSLFEISHLKGAFTQQLCILKGTFYSIMYNPLKCQILIYQSSKNCPRSSYKTKWWLNNGCKMSVGDSAHYTWYAQEDSLCVFYMRNFYCPGNLICVSILITRI